MALFSTIIEASELHPRHINLNDFVGKTFQVLTRTGDPQHPYTVRQTLPSFMAVYNNPGSLDLTIKYRVQRIETSMPFPKIDRIGRPLMLAFEFRRIHIPPRISQRRRRRRHRNSRSPSRNGRRTSSRIPHRIIYSSRQSSPRSPSRRY